MMLPFKRFSLLVCLSGAAQFIFYLWICLLPTQLGFHYWPSGILLKGLRVDYLALELTLTEILLLVLVVLTLFRRCLDAQSLHFFLRESVWKQNVVWYLLVLGIAWGGTQLLWIPLPSAQLMGGFKIFLGIGGYWAMKRISYDRRLVALLFGVQMMILLTMVVAQLGRQGSLGSVWYWLGERRLNIQTPGVATASFFQYLWLRPYATFSHPNVVGGYALLVGIWLWGSHSKNERTNNHLRRLWLFGLLSSIGLVFTSFSQSAWLGLLGAFSLAHLPRQTLNQLKGYSLLLGWLMVPFVLKLSEPWLKFVFGESLWLRNQLFTNYWQLNRSNWLWGMGWHGYLAQVGTVPQVIATRAILQPIHHVGWYLISSWGWVVSLGLGVWLTKVNLKIKLPPSWQLIAIALAITSALDHYWLTQVQGRMLLLFLWLDFRQRTQSIAIKVEKR